MGTKLENATRREASIAKMETQLRAWATQADNLVAGYLAAGAQNHDAYRVRIDALRTRRDVVQTKLDEYASPSVRGAWGTFRATIADDWAALEAGFEDLTH